MKINIVLTRNQLISEKAHLGPAFDFKNYIPLKGETLNEGGAVAFFLSLPAIIKLLRLAIDEGQSFWLEKFNKELYDKIDQRTISSLLDEDSIEDILSQKNLNDKKKSSAKKIIKLIKNHTGKIYKSIDKKSGIKTDYQLRSDEEEERRAVRLDDNTPGSDIQQISEILGAFQHGLHHIYSSAFNYLGEKITSAALGNRLRRKSIKKISDLVGNLLFVFVVCYFLLSGGLKFDFMSGIKSLEIFAEGLECFQIILSSTVILPEVLALIEKAVKTLKSLGLKKIKEKIIDKAVSKEDVLYSSRFAPEMLDSEADDASRSDRSDASQYDYYGNPKIQKNDVTNESILKSYIKNMLLEINHY